MESHIKYVFNVFFGNVATAALGITMPIVVLPLPITIQNPIQKTQMN